jgi:hypothetical protein
MVGNSKAFTEERLDERMYTLEIFPLHVHTVDDPKRSLCRKVCELIQRGEGRKS